MLTVVSACSTALNAMVAPVSHPIATLVVFLMFQVSLLWFWTRPCSTQVEGTQADLASIATPLDVREFDIRPTDTRTLHIRPLGAADPRPFDPRPFDLRT